MIITSKQNPNFKKWKDLLSSRGIREHGACLVSGVKILKEISEKNPSAIQYQLTRKLDDASLSTLQFETDELAAELFEELNVLGVRSSLAVVKVSEIEKHEILTPVGVELILPVGDPKNLGAIVRSAVAFGVKKIWLTEEACNPFLPQSIKASSGEVFNMQFFKTASLKNLASKNLKNLHCLDSSGVELSKAKFPKDLFLLVGEEGPGISESILESAQALRIPTQKVESLNASIAASIALYEMSRK